MYIEGIGRISQEKVLQIFTNEAKGALKNGDMSKHELGIIYKKEMVKRKSKCGNFPDTFHKCFSRISDELVEKLTVSQLAELTDAFNQCYIDAKHECD